MPDHASSPHDDDRLLDVAVAIADGTPIDWATATPADSAAEASSFIARLQCLERLVRGHEAIRSRSSQSIAATDETVLTEARRKRIDSSDEPCRVQWGPLVVLEKIGRGSFGDVYRAWDPRLDREVALKLIPENNSDTGSPVVEEGRLLARIRHPNVLTVYGAERIDGRVGIWTEYIRGETLAGEIARRGPVSAVEAARIGIETCRALAAVHHAGLLHRDVKAQNILRDSTGRIVLGDFGTGLEFEEHAGVTEPQIAGTPLYLAPEIFEHRLATVESDLYSVGVLLYFLVTANYPVRGRTFAEIRRAHATGERVSLRDARASLPETFVSVVETLLRVERDGRFQTAASVESALDGSIGEGDKQADTQPRRRPWIPTGVAGLVAALIAAATLAGVGSRWQPRVETGIATVMQTSDAALQTSDPPLAVERAPAPSVVSSPTDTAAGSEPVTTPLNAGDWVLVASFDNQTGEEVLDGTIEAALKRELEYSDYVRVAQRGRWEDALHLLGRPVDSRLDPSLAREVCLRDGSIRAFITGRVEEKQSTYAVTLTIVNAATGTALATITGEAPNQAQMLLSIRRQALRLRRALGETDAALDRARRELERVPIPALAALSLHAKALTLGRVPDESPLVRRHERWAGVERLVRDSLREDPTFAHAWIMLAWALRNQDRPQDDYLPYARRALDLAETATTQERYFILGSFHQMNALSDSNSRHTDNPKELERALAAYEALLTLQPDYYYVQRSHLPVMYGALGRDRDWALMRIRLADARPANVSFNVGAAATLINGGNLAAARRYVTRGEAALPPNAEARLVREWSDMQFFRTYLDWVEAKPAESLARVHRLAAAIDRIPEDFRRTFTSTLIWNYLALGRLSEAQELAERGRVWEGPEPYLLAYVLRERGNLAGLRDYLTTHWTHDQSSKATGDPWRVEFLVPAGMLEEAERDIDGYISQVPAAAVETSFYPFLMGPLEMARGRPDEAVRFLQLWLGAAPNRAIALHNAQWQAQKLAAAWEALGDRPTAIEVLETGEHPPAFVVVRHQWLTSKAQLARLYRKNGQEQKARVVEARLLKMLAVADADHPLLKELNARR